MFKLEIGDGYLVPSSTRPGSSLASDASRLVMCNVVGQVLLERQVAGLVEHLEGCCVLVITDACYPVISGLEVLGDWKHC